MTLVGALLVGILVHGSNPTDFVKEGAVRQSGLVPYPPSKAALVETGRIPGSHGVLKTERHSDKTWIRLAVTGMKPAGLFGGDYNTYVLWAIGPDDRVENLGELILDADDGKLEASTDLQMFGVVLTAEPHYLVTIPSSFVVLETQSKDPTNVVRYEVVQKAYYFERSTLEGVKHAKGKVHTHVNQALIAVRLARRVGAAEFEEFRSAERLLDKILDLLRREKSQGEIEELAREAVRLAVAAQNRAVQEVPQNAGFNTNDHFH
jgi:hypothetical protein